MRKLIFISILFLFFPVPAFSDQPSDTVSGEKSTSTIREINGELVTPRGNIHVGTSEEKLYEIFQEQDRAFIPQVMLNKECHIFKDWTSNNRNDTITFFVNAGKVVNWQRGYVAACQNKGSKYEYGNSEQVKAWFFPKDKAMWDGSKLSILDWNKLVQVQKIMFITEYINQFNQQYHTNISVNIDKYILGMNYFCDNCPESCRNITAGAAVDNLLISDGKAKEAPPEGK